MVNGERIRKDVVLAAGDLVVIGNLEFELVIQAGVVAAEADSAVLDAVPTPAPSASHEDTQFTDKTVYELPAISPAPVVAAAVVETPAVAEPVAPIPIAPAAAAGDTTVMNMPQVMPGQYPYPQMMPQMMPQMGYPGGMYGGYPYQQPMMPGYGQGYPQMMPQMGYPMQQQAPQQMMPAAPAAEVAAPKAAGETNVMLPNPEDTGAKENEPAKGSSGASKTDTEKPTGAADAIIKQYMGRR